uniref:Protein phosphatase 1, regulatory subunit 26 n=1 Tax=Sphaeramia orbicularis TaxID=375764 RepID=A0A673BWF1_9TELE
MYLMNVPPVAATHTEWRTCGPPGGYSLPICLNDSDTELSTRGTPISDKVQMIIESLRSTQSSLEMGDEMEGNVPLGEEGHPHVCKVAAGSFGTNGSKAKGPVEKQENLSSPVNESHDSDSDDSVDRGIEEAILEYLKEKDGHKRKAEPCTNILQQSKIPRRSPPVPEVSKQNSESNTYLITSNQFPKSVKAEMPTAPAAFPMKKYIKHKVSLNESQVQKAESNKSATTTAKSLELPREQTKNPSKTISLLNKVKYPAQLTDSDDSSSDDGIEEAIQRYQLEKEQQNRQEPLKPYAFIDESDSTSDDGIEEAIRCYQLEQLKEKSVLKPFFHQQKPVCKTLMHAVGGTSGETLRRPKLKKKTNRPEKEVKSVASHLCIPKNTLSDSAKETFSETSPEHKKEVCPYALSQISQIQPMPGLCKTEQSGDKSSSLDSDEDLDTAIKDLLKTKKEVKEKAKRLETEIKEVPQEGRTTARNAIQTKKLKPELFPKHSSLKKVQKSKDEMRDKSRLSTKTMSQHKQNISKEHDIHEGETENRKGNDCQDIPLPHDAQMALQMKDDSSSVDSDDSIEQEIRKFLAEKAKVSTVEKIKGEDESRNGNVMVCTQAKDEGIKQENQLAEIPRKNVPSPSGQSPPDGKQPHNKLPLPMSCSLLPDNSISPVGAQSHLSSVQHCSPGLLEPADGAGAVRTEQRRPSTTGGKAQEDSLEKERVRTVLSSNIVHSRSESIKWRQSLGLPTTDTRTLSRTPFHITSSKMSETPSGAPYQSGGINFKLQTPVSVWSSARTSRSPFPSSTEPAVNATFRSPVLSFLSAARHHPGMPFTQSLVPGFRSQCPNEGDTQSMVHIPKDKSVFVELETNRTNHVQVRNRDIDEGKERAVDFLTEKNREGKSMKMEDKEEHLERTEEEFIDEAESESDNRGNPEKKQGFSTL